MRRWGIMVVLMGVLGTAGIVVAHEGKGEHHGEMPAAVKAIKDKYQTQKEQLHNECKQKMQALEQEEHNELQIVMKAEHEKKMQEMSTKHEQHMKEMEGKYQQHMQEMQKKHE